ncbi:MAG TPA: tail fiber protein [Candidatus Kapabacteria bacterium]|nr:tail fiber protein [Candidatus Kapabacteria bacterium]
MAEPFVGQIIMAGFNFAPRGYATCDGQLLSIAQNTALFSLLGTTFGGDGRVTFGLPDLRGRVPIHQGQGPGLTNRTMGEVSGSETVTLINSEMPMHNHLFSTTNVSGALGQPNGNFLAASSSNQVAIYRPTSDGSTLNPQAIGLAGGNQPHNNMQPYLVINFCIAMEGIFPSRN